MVEWQVVLLPLSVCLSRQFLVEHHTFLDFHWTEHVYPHWKLNYLRRTPCLSDFCISDTYHLQHFVPTSSTHLITFRFFLQAFLNSAIKTTPNYQKMKIIVQIFYIIHLKGLYTSIDQYSMNCQSYK